jgi:hypothetical protein
MQSTIRLLVIAILGLLAACYSTGRQFVRPNLDALELRRTTVGEVVASFGQPNTIASFVNNGKKIERFQYQYYTAAGYAIGVGPVGRTASFFFSDGTLTGYLYTSNYPGDSTDFDETKAQAIVKGKSTKRDVEVLLGKPVGMGVYPLIDSVEDTELRYSYVGGKGPILKNAIFRVGSDGIINDVKVTVEK